MQHRVTRFLFSRPFLFSRRSLFRVVASRFASRRLSFVRPVFSKMDFATRVTIWDLPTTEKTAMEFLQNWGVVPKFRNCTRGHAMNFVESVSRAPYWFCAKSVCRLQIGVRSGNWLDATKKQNGGMYGQNAKVPLFHKTNYCTMFYIHSENS
jgi:hypothetical protein